MKKCQIMSRLLFLIMFLIIGQFNVFANIPLDSFVDYTGNEVARANDTFLQANYWINLGLGGPVGNQFIVEKAFQFTVNEHLDVEYLSVDASVVPYYNIYENSRSVYIRQRIDEGATPEQVGLEINGDGINPPSFVGPAQYIDVNFKIFDGSKLFGNDGHYRPDFDSLLVSTNYHFTTEDSLNIKNYDDLEIPFMAELKKGNTYWIYASDPQFSGATFNYSTRFIGESVVPEPITIALFGCGLVGLFWYKRKIFESIVS